MVKEMAGPAAGLAVGTLVGASGIGAIGLAGAAVAGGASVAATGMGAYFLKQSTDKGFRGGWKQTTSAVTDAYQTLGECTANSYERIKSLPGDSGAGEFENNDDTKY